MATFVSVYDWRERLRALPYLYTSVQIGELPFLLNVPIAISDAVKAME